MPQIGLMLDRYVSYLAKILLLSRGEKSDTSLTISEEGT